MVHCVYTVQERISEGGNLGAFREIPERVFTPAGVKRCKSSA